MKKLLLVVLILGIVGAFILYLHHNTDETVPIGVPSSQPTQSTSRQTSPTVYKDGSYTGTAISMNYGTVEIKAVVSGGKITDVQFLQMPDSPGHTQEVTAAAEPLLKQEAITAQSSQIDIVSGATQTSEAFQQSLDAALAMAK